MSIDVNAYLSDRVDSMTSSGSELVITCPFPDCGKPGHFYVNPEKPAFKCFKCGRGGHGFLDLLCAVEQVSPNEAVRLEMRARRRARAVRVPPKSLVERLGSIRAPKTEAESLVDVAPPPEAFRCWDGKRFRVPKYLTERGVTQEAVAHFDMRYATSGRYARRVILPFSCPTGRSFTGRDTSGTSERRYLNPRKKEDGAEHSRLLYGWPEDGDPGAMLFIVEGPMDAVRMWQHGHVAVALLGKEMHFPKMNLIFSLKPTTIVVMLDPEEAWAPTEVAKRCAVEVENVLVARLPRGVDPGSSEEEEVRTAVLASEPWRGARISSLLSTMDRIRTRNA